MTQLTNLRGTRVGDLTVLQRVTTKKRRPRWRCVCVCGKRVTVSHNRLIGKHPKTHCGCKRKGPPTLYKPEYHAWWDARERCHNKDHPSYKSYGALGVRMCDPWQKSFETFFKDMGLRPTNRHSLDRRDPTGDYEPSNCRWVTLKIQAANKRIIKMVEHPQHGTPIPAAELARELGISYQQLRKQMVDDGEW